MEPYLWIGCNDPYDAIRIIASRVLKTLPGKLMSDFDPIGPPQERLNRFINGIETLETELRVDSRPTLLFSDDGVFDFDRARELITRRDNRQVDLNE